MSDPVSDIVTGALIGHRKPVAALRGQHSFRCSCKAVVLTFGDRWEAHLADVAVAALVGTGHLPAAPVAAAPGAMVVHRYDVTRDTRWRAAALQVCAVWADRSELPQLAAAGRDALEKWWPSLAHALRELEAAKRALLQEPPTAPQGDGGS